HKSAPVAVLERAVVSGDTVTKLLRDVVQAEPVAEAFVVSTCNRVEVYADVDRFHAGVTAICELLARHCGVPSHELTQYLYVHYEDRAVSHLLAVAAGLDSMVVGEDQILGQVRSAVKLAAETAARSGAASITVANRTRAHAERLAASVSTIITTGTTTATVTGLEDLPSAIAAADVVISCTGATGQVITGDMVSAALVAR